MTKKGYLNKQRILQNRLMNQYYPKIVDALQIQIDHAISYIRKNGVRAAQGNIASMPVNPQIGIVIKSLYRTAVIQAANSIKITKKAGFGNNDQFVADVMQYLDRFILNKVVVPISQTMIDEIETVLKQAVAQGWGVDETVSRLEAEEIPEARAKVIVRTESIRAMNFSQLTAADNQFYEVDKQWIAAHDNRTRHLHRETDGERIPLDQLFSNGLMFPGDPEGAASNVINCFLPTEISHTGINLINNCFRRFYKGEVITIETSGGNRFTCTPNHKILTDKGWIRAAMITEEFKLLKSCVLNYAIENFYIENTETSFEEIFNSISYSGNAVRVRTGIMDFHGDFFDSDVDIVSSISHLQNSRKSVFCKKIKSFFFPNSNFTQTFLFHLRSFGMQFYKKGWWKISDFFISIRNKFFPIFQWKLFHSFEHRLASISYGKIVFSQPMLNYISGTSKMDRDRLDADSIVEHIANFILIDKGSDWVIKCSRHIYEGFVYNLSTDSQMYDINGYIAHNCRCTLGYFPRRDANGKLVLKKENSLDLSSKINIGRHGK